MAIMRRGARGGGEAMIQPLQEEGQYVTREVAQKVNEVIALLNRLERDGLTVYVMKGHDPAIGKPVKIVWDLYREAAP